ncbi:MULTISPECIES: Maf family protein [Cysteiniphilum]|uniref:Maf family protein n=1 Tax=Cysteiniphilum TaxID=2056696 RepID=UPI001786E734|nr:MULTISPECIES: Maf family protein [Cysteiniphilum]
MIYLASQSPRRAELLRRESIEFSQFAVDIDESSLANEKPLEYLERVVKAKLKAALQMKRLDLPVLVADTIVVIDEEILQKPINFKVFCAYMHKLSGRWHQVITGFAVGDGESVYYEYRITDVLFAPLTDAEIKAYWQTNEPQDKAGGYAIQGIGQRFVKEIKGDFDNVVGLPVKEVKKVLAKFTFPHSN